MYHLVAVAVVGQLLGWQISALKLRSSLLAAGACWLAGLVAACPLAGSAWDTRTTDLNLTANWTQCG